MAVISVSIIESLQQVVAGIPRSVSITTNIPAAIFYTLDGTVPSLFSNQYIDSIVLPTAALSVTLKVLASNGLDSSPVITENYITNMVEGARLPRAATTASAQENIPDLYPFGNAPTEPNARFLNPAEAGITVDNPALPSIASGYDGYGNPTGFTNQPYDLLNYSIKYPTKDFQNRPNIGVGTFPENVKVNFNPQPPTQSDQNSNMFDPRAFVIFQDSTRENPADPPHINRMHFSLENPERTRDGNNYYVSGLDAPPVSGTFLRSYYNPRTNMMTYYYLDTWSNKWVISTTPYISNNSEGSMAGVAMASGHGNKYVFEWQMYRRRALF